MYVNLIYFTAKPQINLISNIHVKLVVLTTIGLVSPMNNKKAAHLQAACHANLIDNTLCGSL